MALCSLSTGRIATPRRCAASVTSAPAITSTSLLASAIVLPASIAASTASSAAVPDEAHSTMSTSGCVATATRPSAPCPATSGAPRSPACTQAVDACADPIATARGRKARTCSANSGDVAAGGQRHDLEAIADARRRPTSALRPIDPVEPRMAMSFHEPHAILQEHVEHRRRRTAARRCGRARRRGPGISAELSFTPALRFSSDSNRSPDDAEADDRQPDEQQPARPAAGQPPAPPRTPATAGRDDEPADGAFDRLLRADHRRELVAAEGAPRVVLRRVADDDRQRAAGARPRGPRMREAPRSCRAAGPGRAAGTAGRGDVGQHAGRRPARADDQRAEADEGRARAAVPAGAPSATAAHTAIAGRQRTPRAARARPAPRPGARTRRTRARAPPPPPGSSASGGRNQMQPTTTGMRTRPLRMRTMSSLTWRRWPGGAA